MCPVVKSLVNPVAIDASLDGIGVPTTTRPPVVAVQSPETPRVPEGTKELRNIVRTEVLSVLKELGIGGSIAKKDESVALYTAISKLQPDEESIPSPKSAYSDRARRFRELETMVPDMFRHGPDCEWNRHSPMGLELIHPEKPASEPSVLVVEKQRAQQQQQQQQQQEQQQPSRAAATGASAGGDESGCGQFTFVTGSPVVNPRALPSGAARLAVDQVCRYEREDDSIRPGDRLPKLDKLLGIEGIRRAQPKPAQLAKAAPPSIKSRNGL